MHLRWSSFDSKGEFLYLKLRYKINAWRVWGIKLCKANSNSRAVKNWNKLQDFHLLKRMKNCWNLNTVLLLNYFHSIRIWIFEELTIHNVDHNRCWISIRRCTSIFSRVVHINVSNQQIVRERFSVLCELRQPRFRLETQHL